MLCLSSWILNTIDPEIKGTLTKYRVAKRLCDHLKTRFATINGPCIQQIRSSIAHCEQTKSMPVSVYYGKLNSFQEELSKHVPLISSTCCSNCIVGSTHATRLETENCMIFLWA